MMSSRVLWFAPIPLLSLVAMLACGGTSHSPVPAVTDVYAAGYELDDTDTPIAKYWQNGQGHPVGINGSLATSIAVSGDIVYVAGVENNGTVDVAKYWKNGTSFPLTDGTHQGYANGIFISGSDLYVAGGEQNAKITAEYWKNGQLVTLPDLGEGGLATSIFVSGADVYVSGWVGKTTEIDPTHFVFSDIASYWKNGVLTTLADGLHLSNAYSVFATNSDVYVAGAACHDDNPNCLQASYWKNGTLVTLPNGSVAAASSVVVSGSDVYLAGNQGNSFAEAWKNSELVPLTGNSSRSAANQIAVSGGDVYVGGSLPGDGGSEAATYWKNGNPVAITDGTHTATALSIAVVRH